MDIKFSCNNCGQEVVIDEAGAGLTVQCPTCGRSLTVPRTASKVIVSTSPATPPLTVDDTKTCPQCAETVKRAAKVCRFCGYDFVTKQQPPPVPQQIVQQPVETVQARSSVSDGVRLGCGMFIVLPLILLGILALIIFAGMKSCSEILESSTSKPTTVSRPEAVHREFTSSENAETNETESAQVKTSTGTATSPVERTNSTETTPNNSSLITEAFGVTLGIKVNLSAYRKDVQDRYPFTPKIFLDGMSTYYFKVSPRTHLIYRIGAEGRCASDEACNERLKVFLSLLTKKYGAEEPQGFLDRMSDRHEIRSGGRTAVVKCTGTGEVTLELYYNDIALENQAHEEEMQILDTRVEAEKEAERKRLELESKKINSKGL